MNSLESHAERNRVLEQLNVEFREQWKFGSNALVGWRPVEGGIDYIVVPALAVFSSAQKHRRVVNGGRMMGRRTFAEVAELLETKPSHFSYGVPPAAPAPVSPADINTIFIRYTITQTRNRAVFLHDIAGFSLFSPEEQAAQLSTLEYSLNIAEEKIADFGTAVDLARSTTGDGYYAWNRIKGEDADVNVFCVLMVALAHQALQQRKITNRQIPTIRTVFGTGSHYSYHQNNRVSAVGSDYIVGEITINLARLINHAQPNQILISGLKNGNAEGSGGTKMLDFFDHAAAILEGFTDIEMGELTISRISTYLTGEQKDDGSYAVRELNITDKHGMNHTAYNAKVNIFLSDDEPIFLGLQDEDASHQNT
ncbi:MAG: adenylate/guanylate cyclase domain-containing protein [Rhodospirillaceae bacterium]|nr:adenylate/guanylate cyclase domain-containing protein [Rhodospirillaceae bacterium]